jgi:hypothetical protein
MELEMMQVELEMMMQELQMELNQMQELQMEMELNQMQEHKSAAYAGVCEPSITPWCPDHGAMLRTHIVNLRQHE